MLLLIGTGIHAQTGFKMLRYDEDYEYLKKDTSVSWYHHMKFRPLSATGNTYLSIGGELRYQYFWYRNESWGDEPQDKSGYLLSRMLLHGDLHFGKKIRTFVQLQSSMAASRPAASPVDQNVLDIHQAFVDMDLSKNRSLIVRAGRQEIAYGSQRLVSVRELPNNRQAFDAVRLLYKRRNISADAFYSHYVRAQNDIFDDATGGAEKLWGIYTTARKVRFIGNADVYYLGLRKRNTSFDDGSGRELRHSVGTRLWNTDQVLLYDVEGVYQFGDFADGKISAWTLSANLNYTFNTIITKPRLGLKTELISGDHDYNDQRLQTFNPLYPRGAYFGLAALIGPANLFDIHPSLDLNLDTKTTLGIDYDVFWRMSSNDGIYGPNARIIYSGKGIGDQFIGKQLGFNIACQPGAFLFFRLEANWFQPGSFLKQVSAGKDLFFTGVTTTLKF